MWETMKGKSCNTNNMISKPSPPPDRAKTVHHNKRTNFEHFDDNVNQQRIIQNDVGDGNVNLVHAESTTSQPTKPRPHLDLTPRRHNGHGREKMMKLITSSLFTEMAASSAPTKNSPARPETELRIQRNDPTNHYNRSPHQNFPLRHKRNIRNSNVPLKTAPRIPKQTPRLWSKKNNNHPSHHLRPSPLHQINSKRRGHMSAGA